MHLPFIVSSWDNSRIVSGGADKIVFLSDVGTGQPIRKLRGHLSVSGQVYIWNTDVAVLVECLILCRE